MTQYSEPELILPALVLLVQNPAGLTTSDLIRDLTLILKPDGPDMEILAGRQDRYFSQKVRNLVSHRTLEGPGLETHDAVRQHQCNHGSRPSVPRRCSREWRVGPRSSSR